MTDIEQLLHARIAALQVEQAYLQAALARLREMSEEAKLLREALEQAHARSSANSGNQP